jgi:light-regulated signal transduction histidine kinase (bacteriophytochrome)
MTIDTLEISNRDLERMAVVSAHDLSEPLRKIRVFGGRLEDTAGDALDEKSRDYLNRMTSAAERMQGLIDGLLTYSRVTTRAETFEWVDLDEIAHDVMADFDVLIDDTGATVEIGDLPRVMGEPTQMRQLIQNLLSNSLKYYEQGDEPWVRISAEVMDEHDRELPGAICRLIVEDHGIGIPDDYLESVFDLFARLQDQIQYPGSGLGLSVCRRILEHHGGTIVIEPHEPRGIQVIASIPITPQRWD